MVAIAAQYGCKLLKTDTKQALLCGEIGDEKIYIRPPDWWPDPVSQGHALFVDEEHHDVWNSASSMPMASENSWMDGVA